MSDERMYSKYWCDDDDLLCKRMPRWVICSCIHKSDIYIHIGDDRIFISIMAMTRILCIHIDDNNDIVVSWGDDLGDDRYHMHIKSCLEHIANIESVMFDSVVGDYMHWWILVIYVLGEFWCVKTYLLQYYACICDVWICCGVVVNDFN